MQPRDPRNQCLEGSIKIGCEWMQGIRRSLGFKKLRGLLSELGILEIESILRDCKRSCLELKDSKVDKKAVAKRWKRFILLF